MAEVIGFVQDAATVLLLCVGTFLLLVAGIGVVRLPDTFLRMSASSKASSLGAGFILLAVATSAAEFGVTVRALAGLVFLVMTVPVAAHMIGRAAYLSGVPLWKGTVQDDLRGKYDAVKHTLKGAEENEAPGGAPTGAPDRS
jgi:multicomponent Na+:H+ antiporter subunit G